MSPDDIRAPKIIVRVKRLPDEVDEWEHDLLLDDDDLIVSEFRFTGLSKPAVLEGRTITENGYRGMLFEFVKEWYEIIKIWNFEEDLVGYYCNTNMPPVRFEGGYEVTDLFLDLWVFPDMEYHVLDEDELEAGFKSGLMDESTKRKAQGIVEKLVRMIERGEFPPDVVNQYG